MDTIMRRKWIIGAPLLLVAVLLGVLLGVGQVRAALPDTTCSVSGLTRTCDLWATTGTLTMPDGSTVPVWGYADADGAPAVVPGPSLIANAGETVVVNLHNNLSEYTALLIDEQAMMPDLVGVAPGATKTYTFSATAPGTFLYESGLIANTQHQLAMGMYGAFIVRPATITQAYDSPTTAFTDEALLVLSEIDPALNNSADPATFDMRDYMPEYWLINGKAYPQTEPIATSVGGTVLLRYVNAGLEHHSMTVLGLNQTVIGEDGSPLTHPYHVAAESFSPGQTVDALVTVPVTAMTGTVYALYDGNLMLHNGGMAGFGGMLTILTTGDATPPGSDTVGPETSAVVLDPSPTDGLADVLLSASVSDAAAGNANIAAAEYFIDATGADGTGTAMAGAFASPTEAVNATLLQADVAALSPGAHVIYVHGQDAASNWGPFSYGVLQIGQGGPVVSGLSLTPNPSNGGLDVVLNATADDSAAGNGKITAGEYFIDTMSGIGGGTPMTVNLPATVASLDAVIPAATIDGLSEGVHTVYVDAQDSFTFWGPPAMIDLIVDKTGPAASGVTADPNPNNGKVGYNSNVVAIRVTATIADPTMSGAQSTIAAAEGFIDTVGADGEGFPFIPVDAKFDSASETVYTDIPLATIAMLTDGNHTLYVHGKDASGNWGVTSATTLAVDMTGPVISNLNVAPNPTQFAPSATLSADATDGTSTVATAEWYIDTDPGFGAATPFAGPYGSATASLSAMIDATLLAPGPHTLGVRARDSLGNWGPTATIVLEVGLANDMFADGFESGDFSAWSATGGNAARISVTLNGAQAGAYKMEARVQGGTSGYVQDNTPAAEVAYHARFYFNPNSSVVNSTARTIFSGLNAANQSVFEVQTRRSGGNYQVRAVVSRAGGTTATGWFTIANSAFTPIEVGWISGPVGRLDFYVGGTLQQSLTNVDTRAYALEAVRLGPQGALNGIGTATWFFDSFVSTRYTVVGP